MAAAAFKTWKNVALLAVCQGLAMSGSSLIATTSALVGDTLALDKAYSTLPLALQFLCTMGMTIPAADLMRRVGRQAGFMVGAAFGIVGAAISTAAIFQNSFVLFCVGSAVTGLFYGFAIQFRFAAADATEARHRGRAISWVLTGGVVAAVLGPNLARLTRDAFEPILFAGSYASLIGLYVAVIAVLMFMDIPRPGAEERLGDARPLIEIMRGPTCLTAMLCGPIAYGAMSMLMTATPLAMQACGHSFGDTAFVVQWHILGMFAPSFVTGQLINRFGTLNVMACGSALLALCIVVNLAGDSVPHFWAALLLLGLGWNFLFVGATTLLTESYRPAEKAKVQGANDFLVYGTVTLSSFFSGKLHHLMGWEALNVVAVPLVMVTLAAGFWLRTRRAALA
jgi:MFS family permease